MKKCIKCKAKIIEYNHIGLNKKLLGREDRTDFFCINCLAEYLNTTVEILEKRIEEFIEEGCVLFIKKEQTTKERLNELQSLPLEEKIKLTELRIKEWYEMHDKEIYVSFSGGKDSTVLLDIVRKMYPDIEAVFVDTGLEYPEIRDFVKTFENVTWLKPKMSFRKVVETYGYPVIGKEASRRIHDVKKLGENCYAWKYFSGQKGQYGLDRWKFLIEAPFNISDNCCDIMKKHPLKIYQKESNKFPIIGTMASESRRRTTDWVKWGCNYFDKKDKISRPMSFWTEQDVLKYLKQYNISYASVYGDIIEEYTNYKKKPNKPTGKLKTIGLDRTGCMFCMFGCHLDKEPNRFQRMKETHPKQYEYCMRDWEDGGLGLAKVLDFIGVNKL